MFQGYADCGTCNNIPKKYKIDGVRCDNSQYSVTVWSDTLPTIGINDTFRVNDSFLNTFCWKVTAKDNYKTVVYGYPEYSILDTGCSPCDGSAPITPTPIPTDGGGSGGSGGRIIWSWINRCSRWHLYSLSHDLQRVASSTLSSFTS